MSLLDEIREGALDPDAQLAALLRKCLVLSARVGHQDLKEWVQHELNGYPDDAPVPPYRDNVPCDLKATLAGPFGSMVSDVPVPIAALPNQAKEWANKFRWEQSVGELEDLVADARSNGRDRLESPMPPGLTAAVRIYQGHTTVAMWREFSVSQLAGILDRVRTVILEFTLEIEAANPDAGEAPVGSSPVDPERISQIFNVAVNGQVQALAIGESSIATAYSVEVQPGDLPSLRKWLQAAGYSETDIGELERALEEDHKSGEDSDAPGPRTQSWVGKMTTTAARGAGGVATGAAGGILAEVVLRYLGLLA